MSTSRPGSADADADAARETAASDVAASLRDAAFVHVLARADGDSLAAAGILARACAERGVPYQVRVARVAPTAEQSALNDGATTVGVGRAPAADAHAPGDATPASVTAYDAVRRLDDAPSPDAGLALAGVVAAGRPPDAFAHVRDAATAAGVEQRPGVASPVADLADGLAHATFVHADWSGDPEAPRAALAALDHPADHDLDTAARKRVASLVALAVAGDDSAADHAATAVKRALRPHATPQGPFATVEGYADVLAAAAREQPGVGVALALGHDAQEDALAAWRDHATRAHRGLRDGRFERHDGVFVVWTDADAPVVEEQHDDQ